MVLVSTRPSRLRDHPTAPVHGGVGLGCTLMPLPCGSSPITYYCDDLGGAGVPAVDFIGIYYRKFVCDCP